MLMAKKFKLKKASKLGGKMKVSKSLKKKLYFSLVAFIILGTFYYSYKQASSERLFDYIGDEVWYVSSSRNVLHKLGINVHYVNETTGSEGVNIIVPKENETIVKLKIWRIAQEYNYTRYIPYVNLPAVYYEVPRESFDEFLEDVSSIEGVEIIPGFIYPDRNDINEYLNTEHPYLAKGLISLGMLIEDKPINWRLPGLIGHLIINLLVFLATLKISKSYLASFIALIFVAFDPLLYATSLAAMLDIHVALFTAIFMYAMIIDDFPASGVSIGLAAATKLNGAFAYPVLFIKLLRSKISKKMVFFTGIVLPALAFLLSNLPLIILLGFRGWAYDFASSFKWHLSYKGEHPANSPFWEWFISLKPFPFHYNPDVFAATDPILMLSMVVFVFAIPYAAKKRGKILVPFGIFWSTIAFYALQWILGGKTQFSFYATPLVPPGAVVLGVMAYEIIKWEYFENSLRMYWEFIMSAFNWLKGKIPKRKATPSRSQEE